MSSIFSYWSPTDLILPKVEDTTEYGMWYVTDTGTIQGLDLEFNQGDWLIYIKKEGEGSWFKSTGGVTVLNTQTNTNKPDPGFYTKVRLDNNGQIISAEYLSKDDLPKHTHSVNDITDEFEQKIQDVVGDMFQSSNLSSIKFKYDENIHKITAEVNIDDMTIQRNAFGELEVNGEYVEGTGTESKDGSTTPCGNHQHTVSQITDFTEQVQSIIKNTVTFDATQIPIDNTTIILNSYGQLSAVSAGTAKHKHNISDITDLDPNKADVWASEQELKNDLSTEGAINLVGHTIGEAIDALNVKLNEINTNGTIGAGGSIGTLDTPVDLTRVPKPNYLSELTETYYEYEDEQEVTSFLDFKTHKAGSKVNVYAYSFFPALKGVINFIVDDEILATQEFGDNEYTVSPNFEIVSVYDSYYNIPAYKGHYKSMSIKYTIESDTLKEGTHTVRFEHIVNSNSYKSKELKINIFSTITPTLVVSNKDEPSNNDYTSGIPSYKGKLVWPVTTSLMNFTDGVYFRKDNPIIITYKGRDFYPEIETYDVNSIVMKPFNVELSEEPYTYYSLGITGYSIKKTDNSILNTPLIRSDNTDVEQYRVVYENDVELQKPEYSKGQPFKDYNIEDIVPEYEMVVKNNIGHLDNTDYSDYNGPNYVGRTTDEEGYIWINFKFKAPFMGNLKVKLTDGTDNAFELERDGTLKDVQLYVAQTNEIPLGWVDGNIPYDGNSAYNGYNGFNGLDLFKSSETDRYITFGRKPKNMKTGYIYVKIGVKTTINLSNVVSSIKESIDEWS